MSLKWDKKGLAYCGDFKIEVVHYKGGGRVGKLYDYSFWYLNGNTFGKAAKFEGPNSEQDAKEAAESWLRKQAEQMLKDLGGDRG